MEKRMLVRVGAAVVLLFAAGGVSAEMTAPGCAMEPECVAADNFSWYGESGAVRAPVYDEVIPGYWWMPDEAPEGQEDDLWGNRGYVFVGCKKPAPALAEKPAACPMTPAAGACVEQITEKPAEKVVEKIVYCDRIVEKPVEKIVEKIVYRDRIVEKAGVVEKKCLGLQDVYFEFDRCRLTPLARETLQENLEILQANPDTKVMLIGSASPEGADEYNQRLSERRVNTVRGWLMENGLPEDRFTAKAIGEVEVEQESYPFKRTVRFVISECK